MRLTQHPRRDVALVTRTATRSYGDLADDISARADRLRTLAPSVVVLTASMTVEFVSTLAALLRLERPVAIFSPAWTPDERQTRLDLIGRAAELDADSLHVTHHAGPPAPIHPLTRLILFTTGSTGQPKAVQLSDANLRSHTAAVIAALDFRTARAQTLFLPMSYSFGLLGQLIPALEVGMRTDLVERLVDVSDSLAAGAAEGMLSGVPSHFEALLRAIPPTRVCGRVTHVVTAGAHSSPDLRRRLHAACPAATLFNNYGQTEASPRILCLTSRHPHFYSTATGYPVGDLRVRLSAEGELQVSGAQIMLGYLGDDSGTKEKVRDGWLATGDLATIAEDGLVTVTGRTDDLVNVGGVRTSTLEIESALRRVAGVTNASVILVPDPLYGTACVAYVEAAGADVTAERVLSDLSRLVSQPKIPRVLHVVPALPLTPNGKVDKARLAGFGGRPPTS